MIKIIQRLRPDSMLRQLVLVTVLGILVLLTVNYFGVCRIQHTYSNYVDHNRAEAFAAYYLLLKHMNAEQRAAVIGGRVSSGELPVASLAVSLRPDEPAWPACASPTALNATSLFKESVAAYGYGYQGQIKARVIDEKTADPDIYPGLKSKLPLMQITMRLEPGNWLVITQPLLNDDQKLIWSQRLTLLLQLIIFSGAVIIILSRVTNPLCRLTQAAEFFGKQPETQCPLPVTGIKEVREAALSFNRMRARICDNIAERQRMFAAVGHDLRTPLTRAKLRLEEIEPKFLREQFSANLAEIQSIVEQGLELADSLTTSEQSVPLEIRSFVQSLVEDAADSGKNVELDEPGDSRPLVVAARPLCLKRCLENLISNALIYGGNCHMAITAQARSVTLEIKDNGPGLANEMLEKVFEPYFRVEKSRNRSSGGIGLGLSIARNMCALNNGRLTLENRPEGGLKAILVLPAVEMATIAKT